MLLEIVTNTRNICSHLDAVRQTNTGNLTQSRIRLLRRRRVDTRANAALLRAILQCWCFGLLLHALSALTN